MIAAKYEHDKWAEIVVLLSLKHNINLHHAYAIYFKYKTSVNTLID